MVWIFSDYLSNRGGIETYLHALCCHLIEKQFRFRVAVCEMSPCDIVDELQSRGVQIYRQSRLPGDRWRFRQRVLASWLIRHVESGDWVFCVRQPMPEIYERLVIALHRKGARIAASWNYTPDFLEVRPCWQASFNRAVSQTDCVISVSSAGVPMYRKYYGFKGKVSVVPYHNLPLFDAAIPIPTGPPWRLGYIGRIEEGQKNLEALVRAFSRIASVRSDVTLDIHGDGPDLEHLQAYSASNSTRACVKFHGRYDHRCGLPTILGNLHALICTSRSEGGPCFSLLEAMQAGRFVLASAVGGIPDLYRNHPEAGILIADSDEQSIERGLMEIILRLDTGDIGVEGPRKRYDEGFTMEAAHRAWCCALGISEQGF